MSRRTVVITGATGGIGQATATELARRGDKVIITARSDAKGRASVDEISAASGAGDVSWRLVDLASLDSVRLLVADLRRDLDRLDVLIDNAGVVQRRRTETVDGFETTFAVNHLGPFALTTGLLDLMVASAPARIVVVASHAHRFARDGIDFDDLQSVRSFRTMRTYGRSKLANLLFVRELARRLDGTGVTVHAVHPGAVRSRLGRDGDGGRLGEVAMTVLAPFFRSPARGAETSVWAATAPELADVTGRYYADCREVEPSAHALDDGAAQRLWYESERLVAG